ncbi:hypothetical protein C8R45DRAFT_1091276 [Mycena sanguinolenta]|nr:hypothetical protein C8R45DRAFT_1091276 [Mycena sanguinolenta]
MPHEGPPCTPIFFDGGLDHTDHDNDAGKFYYVVVKGKEPGIYFNNADGLAQVHRVHEARWEKFPTKERAVEYWNGCCLRLHTHEPPKSKSFCTLMENVDISRVPLTKLLDYDHLWPSPTMTLSALRTPSSPSFQRHSSAPYWHPAKTIHFRPQRAAIRASDLEDDICRLKYELIFWKELAYANRARLELAGIECEESWQEEK